MSENKFTPRAEEVLRLSQEAAEDLGHGYVGSEHLLLGLIREEEGIAHRVLSEFGVTDEMVCSVLQRGQGRFRRRAQPGPNAPRQERGGAGCVRGVPHGQQRHRHRPSADGPAP